MLLFEPSTDVFFQDHAAICITAHFGNWEIQGQAAARLGVDLASIAAAVKNPYVDKYFRRMREKTGQTIIPQEGALKTMIARFRNKGKAAFVLDQNTGIKDGGIWAELLGMPTPVSPAPASLAYRTGTLIAFAFCRLDTEGIYRVYSSGSLPPPAFDKSQDTDAVVKELTQQILDRVSAEIRAHPESWLWVYKHWRKIVPGDDPANYPSYD